ncbi:hypothetical protein [Gordonia paraffinivorans]|uniref:hypothetical protein n=1 Tax=Gordonia paraffinivorans TaxID=175628 RepID=UPI003FCD69EF
MNPKPTENELGLLDHLEQLTVLMAEAIEAGDGEAFLDALEESQFADRRLMASRDNTWDVWFSNIQKAHKAREENA